MMTTDVFKKRATALEDEFFRRVDAVLAKKLKDQWQHEHDVESLKEETRINDNVVIEELLHVGILPGTIHAMTLVPAIHVAWANGYVEAKERDAVIQAAHSIGISEDSTTGSLLVSWLDKKPSSELFQVWEDYVAALHGVLDVVSYRHLHKNATETAQSIAEAAGGILGVHAVSVKEQRAIQQIDEAFKE